MFSSWRPRRRSCSGPSTSTRRRWRGCLPSGGATPRPVSRPGDAEPRRTLADQPVELARVLAGHLVSQLRGQMAELLVDVLRRLRPHAVAVRIVRAPHQRLHAHVVDELGADTVELEGRLALAAPVVARLHLQAEVVEAVLPLEVHAVQGIGHPADAALSEGDADAGIALEDGAADDGGQDVDEVHLEGDR